MKLKRLCAVLAVGLGLAVQVHAQIIDPTILSENFEGVVDSRISISTRGSFNSPPGVQSNTSLGSPHCFGFGISSCAANCYWNYVTFMYFTFPGGTNVSQISFKSIELYGDFGSAGYVFLDPPSPPTSEATAIAGFHTYASPTGSNTFVVPINQRVTNIVLAVEDIASASEIYIDDLRVMSPGPIATATTTPTNGYISIVTVTYGGYGYTNTPSVRFIGGGGSGAQAVAVVSNGMVTAVNVLNPGSGYTSAPVVVIAPPFIPKPVLSIAPMSYLSFSSLTLSAVYQLQQWVASYWSNQLASFTATNASYTQIVAGVASSGNYRLALSPVPAQAFATALVSGGFVVGAPVTSPGSGYVVAPAVTIVGGGGSNATAVITNVPGGMVTNITITNPGNGYTSTPTVRIGPPPDASLSPSVVLPMMGLYCASLAPYDNYQIQFKPDLGGAWGNWNGGLFSPTNVANSQYYVTNSPYLFITNGVGFFRLQHLP